MSRAYTVEDEPTLRPMSSSAPRLGSSPAHETQSIDQTSRTVFSPRWKSWSPARAVLTTVGFGLVMSLLVIFSPKLTDYGRALIFNAAAAATTPPAVLQPESVVIEAAAVLQPESVVIEATAVIAAEERADASLSRKGRSPLYGGLLTIPPSFASADGTYDLVIHFHGNTNLVEESYKVSAINAVVLILNLGDGSGAYEDRFANPTQLAAMLERTRSTLEKRGLRGARLRRLALTAWSAGYGAVLRILEQPALAEKVDAVVLLDGIHCGYAPSSRVLIKERLAPFERFAELSAGGKKLFSITHSDIIPSGDYAGTHETTDALLQGVGAKRLPGGEKLPLPTLTSMVGVLPKKSLLPLKPLTEAHLRGLHVRGYAGDQAEQHIMHLVQMSVIALPDLTQHWSGSAPAAR
jgi:hypothetical protein